MNSQSREKKARIHRWLVLGQLMSPIAAVCVAATSGLGWAFFAALGLTILLMLTSLGLQIWWLIEDERRKAEIDYTVEPEWTTSRSITRLSPVEQHH